MKLLLPFLLSACVANAQTREKTITRVFYPDQLATDVNVLEQSLKTFHPGLYRYNSKEDIDRLFADLRKRVQKPMNEKSFYLLTGKLLTKIRCGHTYMNPLNMEENIAPLYMPSKVMPLCFVTTDNSFIVTHNMSGNANLDRGTEIVAVNGVPVVRIKDSLLQVSRSDGKNGYAKQISNMHVVPERVHRYSVTDIFFPLFFAANDDFRLTVEQNGIRSEQVIKGVTLTDRSVLYRNIYGPVPRAERSLRMQILNETTAVLTIPTFSFYGSQDPFSKFVDSAFSALAVQPGIKNLILDLRQNEGGSGSCRDRLLSYVLPTDFKAEGYKERRFYAYKKVPTELLPFLGYIDSAGLKTKPDSVYFKNELGFYENKTRETGNFADFAVQPNRFKGNIYLLTSPVNSSAGFEFAWIFQQYKAGTIVGEKTGGTKQGINGGNYFWLRLPYSRVEVDLPFIYQAHLGEPDEGITPDHLVPTNKTDIRNGIDTQIQYVLKLIGAVKRP